MAAYIRVELHEKGPNQKPSSDDYAKLHEHLATKGIETSVEVTSLGRQRLPTGFYYSKATDKSSIGADVKWAASQLGFSYSYVVVISAGALVHNLTACD